MNNETAPNNQSKSSVRERRTATGYLSDPENQTISLILRKEILTKLASDEFNGVTLDAKETAEDLAQHFYALLAETTGYAMEIFADESAAELVIEANDARKRLAYLIGPDRTVCAYFVSATERRRERITTKPFLVSIQADFNWLTK